MTVLLPVANGSEEMEAVIVVDMLRRASVDVIVAGDADIVHCSRGIRLIPDKSIDDIDEDRMFDAIVLPGGRQGVDALATSVTLENIVRRHHAAKRTIAAICAAPLLLHDWALLKKASVVTCHPSIDNVMSAYTLSSERVVVDGHIVTSRGAGTAIEFALTLIRLLVDETTALRIAGDIVLYE